MPSHHAVLIDDDPWVCERWLQKMKPNKRKMVTFSNGYDFIEQQRRFDRRTPVFIDLKLQGQALAGVRLLEKAHGKGFSNLYIATAFETAAIPALPEIKGVIGKEPPHWLINDTAPQAPSNGGPQPDHWDTQSNLSIMTGPKTSSGLLSADQRRAAIAQMNAIERSEFARRINQLQELRYGSCDAFLGLAEGFLNAEQFEFMEDGIYRGQSDKEIQGRIAAL